METPEQKLPDKPIPGPWESCFTLGTQWQFKPTNEDYKSGDTIDQYADRDSRQGRQPAVERGP